ncbi:MAG: hypothetical protein KAS75_03830 [Planctomycetes bacterium]|nr:hypothetical protein [Planctomycetota bacterium]
MKKTNSNQCLHAIVVGSSGDEFIRHTLNLLSSYDIEHVLFEDIYRAFSWLLRDGQEDVLVVGRVERLNKEEGRFLQKVSDRGFSCCCFADKYLAQKQGQVSAAQEKGAFVINEPAEVEDIIKKLLAGSRDSKASTFNKDEFLTTKAELDALLGI